MSVLTERPRTQFTPPPAAFADAPAERRGVPRDQVRLLVATSQGVVHDRFSRLADHLLAGDLVVVNNSATQARQLDAELAGRGPVVLHLASPLDDGTWVVELRSAPDADQPILDAIPGTDIRTDSATLSLVEPYPWRSSPSGRGNRLWRATVRGPIEADLTRRGRPIAYGYLAGRVPLADYQTVFASQPGSAEMPSAGRPFSHALVRELASRGIGLATLTLHTGVSSQETGEGPQPEWFAVPEETARLVSAARARGKRVIAVGTTVTRALESAVDPEGRVVASRGWTDRVITPDDPPRIVDGLISGWHDPDASHLLLVEAVAGTRVTQAAYDAAVTGGYLWHEFGDSSLLIPTLRSR